MKKVLFCFVRLLVHLFAVIDLRLFSPTDFGLVVSRRVFVLFRVILSLLDCLGSISFRLFGVSFRGLHQPIGLIVFSLCVSSTFYSVNIFHSIRSRNHRFFRAYVL